MNKLVCLFALVCCLSFAACKVEEFYPPVSGVEYPSYYPYFLKSIFTPWLHKSIMHGYGYPYYKGMHEYSSQMPYGVEYPYFYPYSSEYQYPGYGSLPSTYYQYPFYKYQYQHSISKPYSLGSSFYSYPYSSLSYPYYQSYPYNFHGSYPYSYPYSYPTEVY